MQWKRLILSITLTFFHVFGLLTEHTTPRYNLTNMINGTAHTPFVYRQLIPTLLSPMDAANLVPVLTLLVFGCYWLTLTLLGGNTLALSLWLALLMAHYNHIYDVPMLALSTAMVVAYSRQRPALYGALFVVACLNKETAILFVVPLLADKRWRLALVLGGAWVAVRGLLVWRYAGNAGGAFEFHLFENLITFAEQLEHTIAYVLLIGVVMYAVRSRWHALPHWQRVSLATIAPALSVLYLVGGMAFEWRVFYELLPFVWFIHHKESSEYHHRHNHCERRAGKA